MLKIKEINDLAEKRNKLIELLFVYGYQRKEIVVISDYNNINEILNDIRLFDLPERMTPLGKNLITLNYYFKLKNNEQLKSNIHYDLTKNRKKAESNRASISVKDFYNKYHLSLNQCKSYLMDHFLDKYDNEEKDQLFNLYESIVDIKQLIRMSDLIKHNYVSLKTLCEYFDLNYANVKKLMRQYSLTQNKKDLTNDEYKMFINNFYHENKYNFINDIELIKKEELSLSLMAQKYYIELKDLNNMILLFKDKNDLELLKDYSNIYNIKNNKVDVR